MDVISDGPVTIDADAQSRLQLGQLTFDAGRGDLVDQAGRSCRLRPKAFRLLSHLVAHPNRLLTRAHLSDTIWPDVHVTEDSLTHLVREVRRAIGDGDGRILKTVPGRGYVFAPPIQVPEWTSPPMLAAPTTTLAPLATPPATGVFSTPATNFVGRKRELAELAAQARAHRLVTITGMGGIGKTRLLQRFVIGLQAGLPGEATLLCVDLCPVLDGADLYRAISQAFGLVLPDTPSPDIVISLLRHRRGTVLIDNAEHLIAELAPLISLALQRCPGFSFVVTSRIALSIPGESIFRLDPLPVPPPACRDAELAMQYDAVRLFMDRVKLVNPAFRLEDAQPETVAEICRKLDGIALAIEMAVPRMQVLTAEQFLQRLDHRFNLLTQRGNAGPLRQRSLRNMLEWSWELLWKPDQELLSYISIFVGSVSLAALVRMRDAQTCPEWSVIDGLTQLVRASMVINESSAIQPRFRLLETTRAFAQEQLPPETAAALRRRHLEVFVELFEAAEAEWPVMDGQRWIERYGPDADNVRAALAYAFSPDGDAGLALRLVAASRPLWWELPNLPLREACHWFDLAASRIGPETRPAVAGRIFFGQSWRDIAVGDTETTAAARQAVALLRPVGNPAAFGAALWRLGCSLSVPKTQAEAIAVLDEAILALRPLDRTKWLAQALLRRGALHEARDELEDALQLYNEAFSMAAAIRCRIAMTQGVIRLAELLFRSGSRQAAITLMSRLRHEIRGAVAIPLVSKLAADLAVDDQTAAALDAIGEVLGAGAESGLSASLARAIETLAMILAEAGQAAEAARLLGWTSTHRSATGQRSGSRLEVSDRVNLAIRMAMTVDVAETLLAEGALWSEAMAHDVAIGHHLALAATWKDLSTIAG